MIRVIICDDHPMCVRACASWSTTPRTCCSKTKANGHELLEKTRKRSFDVILLDISLPEYPDGLEILKAIKRERPRSAVLVLSMQARASRGRRGSWE